MTALIGKAALTQIRTTSRRIAFVRQGAPVPEDITPEDRERLLAEGYLEVVVDPSVPLVVRAEDVTPDAPLLAPHQHTVKDVLSALEEFDNDRERARELLLREQNGPIPPRSTLVRALEDLLDRGV